MAEPSGAEHTSGAPSKLLGIGELAARAGLTPTAVRMWESRFGFPRPERLPGRHRRYTVEEAGLVQDVVRSRDAGMRLEEAIRQVLSRAAPSAPSVFATLRDQHPQLDVHRLRKSTLLAMSWAIEDQVAALAQPAVVWGAFQQARYYRRSIPRWRDLASVALGVTVFAGFEESDPDSSPRRVAMPQSAPMRREWAVVVDSRDLPVALTAWEPLGQGGVADRNRVFEAVWTIDPVAVRDAARVCAQVACAAGPEFDREPYTVPPPLDPARAPEPSLQRVGALFGRLAAYVDRFAPVEGPLGRADGMA